MSASWCKEKLPMNLYAKDVWCIISKHLRSCTEALIIYFLNSDYFEMYKYYTPFTQKDSLKNS